MPAPRVFSIAPGAPFLPTLADALIEGRLIGGWPAGAGLADATIYLPTRRAAAAFRGVLAERLTTRATLLPRIVPLAEAEDVGLDASLPSEGLPVISPLERRLILTRLVQSWAASVGAEGAGAPPVVPSSPANAVALAADLERLMDSLGVEGVAWNALAGVVESDHSDYFATTLRFLRIAREGWPEILATRGAADPARRAHDGLLGEAARLRADPTAGPVIAAGSTGSMPATAALLAAIARLPHGAVVLPGLDRDLDEAAWLSLAGRGGDGRSEPIWGHPQHMLRRLLADHLLVDRESVLPLGFDPSRRSAARRRMVSQALRPAGTTEAWAALPEGERSELAREGAAGLALIEAADEREEALAVAVAIRETLAEPGRTAILVTPDRGLARRVAVELGRWNIVAHDTAGAPLADTAAGRLARLAAEAAADRFGPLAVLALLAHPAVRLGLGREEVERATAALEIAAGRGPRPKPGLGGFAAALALRRKQRGPRDPLPRQRLAERDWDAAASLLRRLRRAFAGFMSPEAEGELDMTALARGHAAALDRLVRPGKEEVGAEEPCGMTEVRELLDELALAAAEIGAGGSVAGRFGDYPAFFAALARERVLAPARSGAHPHVQIMGLLEARLLGADRAILGGLDEGIWPPTPATDTFLNRPMRLALGLSPPERRIGQTAHDFAQALGAEDAILTRARKRAGKPTTPSRFIQRLEAFTGEQTWAGVTSRGRRYIRWAAALDATSPAPALRPPAPRPGGSRFPRELSVTEIETLVREPYAIYARHVLRLTALDPVAMAPSAADRGSILHDIIGQFAAEHPSGPLPSAARETLLQRGLDAFREVADAYPELHALWWPDFLRIAPHYLAWENERRLGLGSLLIEARGRLEIPLGGGARLALRGRADRIELGQDGAATILDFKTGTPPEFKPIGLGFSPQLTLEAAILLAGGFENAPAPAATPALAYVKLGGRDRLKEKEIAPHKKDERTMAQIVRDHRDGLERLLRRYVEENEPYRSRPFPNYAKSYSDYDHLARVKEWAAAAELEGEAA